MIKNSSRLDLSKYRTPELVSQITEILSLRDAILWTMFFCLLGGASLAGLIYWLMHEHLDSTWLIALCCWGFFAGGGSGFLLGIARIINRGVKNISMALTLLLNMVQHASQDLEIYQSGEQRPTTAELTIAMHKQVIEPCCIQVIEDALGFLAKPVIWFYKSSLGRAVAALLEKIDSQQSETESFDSPDKDSEYPITVTPENYEKSLAAVSTYGNRVAIALKPARSFVMVIGTLFRFVVLMPLYGLFFLSLLVAVIPVIIVRLWS